MIELALIAVGLYLLRPRSEAYVEIPSIDSYNHDGSALNVLREEYGLYPVEWDSALAESALDWANVLNELGYLQHDSENVSENVYYGDTSNPFYPIRSWEHSPGHLANMLSDSITTYGMGMAGKYAVLKLR